MKIHTVHGATDVKLHVREYGKSTGLPILLIHGWSQSHFCWSKQYESALKDDPRMVALDLRGHGMSDAPAETDQYADGDKWADDIAAVIDQLGLDRPILVGWSYAGYIISDYVRRKGQGKIAGTNYVDAAVVLNQKAFGTLVGPGFLWTTRQALVRTIFRRILRQFVGSYVPASSSQSRRTISRKSWLSIWL
jgi:non-heme chloroperoxidase